METIDARQHNEDIDEVSNLFSRHGLFRTLDLMAEHYSAVADHAELKGYDRDADVNNSIVAEFLLCSDRIKKVISR